jgi:Zn-dependent M28 family amino/carboxypeptidase
MKSFYLVAILLLTLHGICYSQADRSARFASGITGASLKKHLSVIASGDMEGRETGTRGQVKAAAYIEAQFRQLGLSFPDSLKAYQQLYPLYKDSVTRSELQVEGRLAEPGKDYYSQLNLNENGGFSAAKLVFAGYGIEDSNYSDYKGLDVKGKIVLLFLGEPVREGKYLVSGTTRSSAWTYPGTSKKVAMAASKGAAGVFIINPSQLAFIPRTIAANKVSSLYYPRKRMDSILVNHVILSQAYASAILNRNLDSLLKMARTGQPFGPQSMFESNLKTSFEYAKVKDSVFASNVMGLIEGTDKKDELVFLTAHYDHLGKHDGGTFYGADDDGSGTCAVIDMAEAFTKARAAGLGPRRTVVFMTVSGEEKGLWGSEYYSDHPVFPLEKTTVDLNTDMVGRTDTERSTADSLNYVYVIGHDKLSSDLPVINEGVNKKYTNLVLDYKYDDPNDQNRIYFRSDHYNFARKGVPILFFYDGMLKADYHKTTDTIEKINWGLYEKRVRMIFHTAWEIANRDEMLKRDIPLTEGTR